MTSTWEGRCLASARDCEDAGMPGAAQLLRDASQMVPRHDAAAERFARAVARSRNVNGSDYGWRHHLPAVEAGFRAAGEST